MRNRQQSILEKSIVYSLWSKVFPGHRQAQSRDLQTSSLQSSVFSLRSSKGFTLLEMLVVVAILLLLASLILAAVNVASNKAKVLRARRDVAQLKTALGTYYGDYSAFPDIAQDNSISNVVGMAVYITGHELIQTLRGREGVNNPKRIPYMDFHQNTTTFNDPWGNKYRISMDTSLSGTAYDGEINVPPAGTTLRQSVAAWSAGPDGQDGNKDDVRTWRQQ